MLNETLLIQRLQAKDARAFQELINEFGPRLFRAARLLTGNEQEAEELTSDTFTDAFFAIRRFRQESNLFSWLYGILLNKFYYRQRRRKREVSLNDSLQPSVRPINTSDNEMLNNLQEYLPRLLGKISLEHREVILLKYLEDMKIEEISRLLKIPEGTVKTRLHYAIINLRKMMKEMNLLPDDVTYW